MLIFIITQNTSDDKYTILSNTYKEFTMSSFRSHSSKYLCFNYTDIFDPHSNSMRPAITVIISILKIWNEKVWEVNTCQVTEVLKYRDMVQIRWTVSWIPAFNHYAILLSFGWSLVLKPSINKQNCCPAEMRIGRGKMNEGPKKFKWFIKDVHIRYGPRRQI